MSNEFTQRLIKHVQADTRMSDALEASVEEFLNKNVSDWQDVDFDQAIDSIEVNIKEQS